MLKSLGAWWGVMLVIAVLIGIINAIRPARDQCVENAGRCLGGAYIGCAAGVTVDQCKSLYATCRTEYKTCSKWAR